MQLARVHGPGDVRVDDVPAPVAGPRDAVVAVTACGICGTDLSYIRQGGLAGPGPEPMALGHELAGVVTQVGPEVRGVAVGDRVVVHPGDDRLGRIGNGAPEGGLAPEVLVRDAASGGRLVPVPDDLPLEVAALAEPLAVGMHAVEQVRIGPGDRVAVFGCGPIGLCAVAALVDRGVDDVVAVDPSSERRDLAEGLGAGATLDPSSDDVWEELARRHGTEPFMFGPTPATEAFIEASGAPSVITDVIDRARRGARLSVVALHPRPIEVNFTMVLMKELSLTGSMEYPDRFEDAVDLLARRDLSALATHRVGLDDLDDALDLLRGSRACGKVLVTFGRDATSGEGS